jgi:hypothetical protein
MAATLSAQPRLWQGGHRPEAATARGGIVLMAERPSTTPGGDVGVAGCRPTDKATKGHRKHQEARVEALARPAGADHAARARSTGRSSEAMATIGGEVDESDRQRCKQGEKPIEIKIWNTGAITYGAYPLAGQSAAGFPPPRQGTSCRSPTNPGQ